LNSLIVQSKALPELERLTRENTIRFASAQTQQAAEKIRRRMAESKK